MMGSLVTPGSLDTSIGTSSLFLSLSSWKTDFDATNIGYWCVIGCSVNNLHLLPHFCTFDNLSIFISPHGLIVGFQDIGHLFHFSMHLFHHLLSAQSLLGVVLFASHCFDSHCLIGLVGHRCALGWGRVSLNIRGEFLHLRASSSSEPLSLFLSLIFHS